MVRLFIGLGIVALGLLIYCLIENFQTPRHRVRVMPKAAWLAVIVLVPLLGPGLWMAFGRTKGESAPPRTGPAAPDDDPEFLRQVEIQRLQKQRREEEVRRRAEQERAKNQGTSPKQDPQAGNGRQAPQNGRSTGPSAGETPGADDADSSSEQDRPEGGAPSA